MVENEEDRKIIIVVGTKGGEGKTTVAKYLEARGKINEEKSAQIITTLDHDSVALMWNPSNKIVIFDLPLGYEISRSEGILIEKIKNGTLDVRKYRSQMKESEAATPIVVIFTNNLPPGNLFMPDRYQDACYQIIRNKLKTLNPEILRNFIKNREKEF